jgi:hypothetical protein
MPSGYRSSRWGIDGDAERPGGRRSVVRGPGVVAAPVGPGPQVAVVDVPLQRPRIRLHPTRTAQLARAALGLASCLGVVVLFAAAATGCGDTTSPGRATPTTADTGDRCPPDTVPAPAGGQSTESGAIGGQVTPSPTVRHRAGLPSATTARPATPILTSPAPGTTETCAPGPGDTTTTDAPGELPGSHPATPAS